ncbi:MAG TPA: ferritin-like domain-containing protein [Stenotrophomonas sp.]|jgi:CDGSH-type Zn-finger protein/uncharacterized Fe-S cluster protein YjdI
MTRQATVPVSREQLWGLLAEAAEIEHHLMCCYLYAAFSLKERLDEDLSEAELAAVQRWRQHVLSIAVEEMGHLATVCNLLCSLGAPAHLVHQNFPVATGYHPAGVVVKLTPFNAQTLAHFIYLERPEGAQIPDGEGFEPARAYVRDGRMDRLMSSATNYDTVGQLYHSISAGLDHLVATLGEAAVFVGNPAHQLGAQVARLPGLKVVRCLKTAQCAITAVVEQGEGAEAANEASHYQRFLAIQREYAALQQARPAFRPARMSAHNPVMRRPPTPEGKLWITREPAASVLDLGNALYNHSLRCLALAWSGVGEPMQRSLVQASVDLMHLLTPVATILGTLPASPDLPEATAGLSFATLRSSGALLADVASVDVLLERLDEIQGGCAQLGDTYPDVAGLLAATRDGVGQMRARLARGRDAAFPAERDGIAIHAPAGANRTSPGALVASTATATPTSTPASTSTSTSTSAPVSPSESEPEPEPEPASASASASKSASASASISLPADGPAAASSESPQAPAALANASGGIPEPIDEGHGVQRIPGPQVDLIYDGKRCIHARHCVLGLPGVFIANIEGPWIHPAAASTEELVTIAHLCPSGAIGYRRHDGGAEEASPPVNLIQLRENGPLGVRAHIVLDGEAIGMRAVLCRCGASKHKPFCDGSHNDIHFQATGEPATTVSEPLKVRGGELQIDPQINGPLSITGNLEICCGTGRTVNRVTSATLCRCGGSANKPYCDGTHRTNGFRSQ